MSALAIIGLVVLGVALVGWAIVALIGGGAS